MYYTNACAIIFSPTPTSASHAVQDIRQLNMKQEGFLREISDLQETVEWKDKKIGVRLLSPRWWCFSLFTVPFFLCMTVSFTLHTLHVWNNWSPPFPLWHSGLCSGLRATERIHRRDPNWARWAQRRGGEAQRHSEGTWSVNRCFSWAAVDSSANKCGYHVCRNHFKLTYRNVSL